MARFPRRRIARGPHDHRPQRTLPTLFVDIGGVLVRDPRASVARMIGRAEDRPAGPILAVYQELSRAMDSDRLDLRGAHRALRTRLGLRIPYGPFERIVKLRSLHAFDLNLRLLDRVRARLPFRVVLASNTSRELWQTMARRFGLARRFPDQVLSFRVGAIKPSVRFFRTMLRKTGTRPIDAYFLDDNPDNVRVARGLGIRARRIRSPSDARRVFEGLLRGPDRAPRGRRPAQPTRR